LTWRRGPAPRAGIITARGAGSQQQGVRAGDAHVNNPLPVATPGRRSALRKSRWPARLDWAQSVSGLVLALFMWAHMLFVSSILLGKDAMWTVARFFEGEFVFGRSLPWVVSIVVAGVFSLVVVHALLAVRKFPISYGQYRSFRDHMIGMHHGDTTLWWWQVVTGFAMFFLASIHLYVMLSRPDRIGPFESADRVWTDHFWPLYLVLLFAVELHGGVGLYRLAVKWGWFAGPDANATRSRLHTLKWVLSAFFVALGLATLAAYVKIGIEHAPNAGQPYAPAWAQPAAR
jgi:fumarate reductase subunit C